LIRLTPEAYQPDVQRLYTEIKDVWQAHLLVENIWLQPHIVGRSLRLHPGLVFVAVVGILVSAGALAALVIFPLLGSAGVVGHYVRCEILGLEPWPEAVDHPFKGIKEAELMDPLLQFLLALAIVVIAAKGSGYLSTRLGQPAVLGELLAGLILGPTVLDMLHWPVFGDEHLGETLSHLAHLGVLFLMFIAGLEIDVKGMMDAGRPAVLAGLMGVITPVALGMATALPFGFDPQQGLFIGLVLAATSVSISAQCLMELGVLGSQVCVALLGAAVVDDVLVILLLSLFVTLTGGGSGGVVAVIWVLVKMIAFLGLATWLGVRLIPRLGSLVDQLPISEGVMALVVVVTLLYAWAAEALGGVAAITGAFLAGLLFARTPLRHYVETRMSTLAYTWLVPVFFVSIGLEANALALGLAGLPFTLLITIVALISKVLGCGIGARLGGFSNSEALRLGVGMTSRGEVGLIVASVGLDAGLIGEEIFAGMVLMVLATTLLTPIMLRALYPQSVGQPELTEVTGP
jgi:Kef-type K+ transport system membrane component KefB